MQAIWLFIPSLISTLAFVTIMWCYYFYRRNAGMLDVAWPFMFLLILALSIGMGDGAMLNKILIALAIVPWGMRLGWHLMDRFEIKVEDKRYTRIRNNWGGDKYGIKFIGMFWFQGLLAALISTVFYLAATSHNVTISSWFGLVISLIGFMGETVADYQLRKFKKNNLNQGGICRVGLWNWSRHPNYFFEWLVWVGAFFIGLTAEWGWIGLVSPLIMYVLLRYVSGVPMLERDMLKKHGEEYIKYCKEVPVFFPF